MSSDTRPGFTFHGEPKEVTNPSEGIRVDLDDLRARRVWDGNHLWAAGLFFYVEDPDINPDNLTLGADNLLAYQGIVCMFCKVWYRTKGDATQPCVKPE